MKKILIPLVGFILFSAAPAAFGQLGQGGHKRSLTGLNDPEPAAPRNFIASLTAEIEPRVLDAYPQPDGENGPGQTTPERNAPAPAEVPPGKPMKP